MSFRPPQILQSVPVNDAGQVSLAWTAAQGTGPYFGNYTDMEVQRAAATFSGLASASGTVMTVSVVNSGAIQVGDAVGADGAESGTVVSSFGTGAGGLGTYNLSGSVDFDGFVATAAGAFSTVATLAASAVSYLDTPTPNETYIYRIQATYDNGAYSPVINFDDEPIAATDPEIVLVGAPAGNVCTDVLLTWTPLNCSDSTFTIYKNGVAQSPVLSQPNLGFVMSQLSRNTSYQFYVVGDVNGASNIVTVNTGCCEPNQEIFNCDCTLVSAYATLVELRTRILIRLGYPNQAANPPPGMSALVDDFLYGAQKLIWKQLSRAGLNVERFFRWVMVPGQRYYGIDSNADNCTLKLDPYKIVWAGFEDLNRAWYRLTEGVPAEFYTRANINFGWPTHYEVRSCIELFPAPQAPYTLWIKGDFGLASFVADDDAATIDDEAIFLLALGNAKAHYRQSDSSQVLAQADTYIRGLVAGIHGTRRYVPRTSIQNPATPPRFLPLGNDQA